MRFQSLPFICHPLMFPYSSHIPPYPSCLIILNFPHVHVIRCARCLIRLLRSLNFSPLSDICDICAMGTVDVDVLVAPDVAWRRGRTTSTRPTTTSRHGRKTWTAPRTWRRSRGCRRCRCRGVGSSAPRLAVAPASCRSGRKQPRNRKKGKKTQPQKRQTQKALEIERFSWKAPEAVLLSHKASQNHLACCLTSLQSIS